MEQSSTERKKELLKYVMTKQGLAKILGISKSKFYMLYRNRYMKHLINNREKLLAEAILSEQVRDYDALCAMAQVLLMPFARCEVPEDLEIPQEQMSAPEQVVFSFLKDKKKLSDGLTVEKIDESNENR